MLTWLSRTLRIWIAASPGRETVSASVCEPSRLHVAREGEGGTGHDIGVRSRPAAAYVAGSGARIYSLDAFRKERRPPAAKVPPRAA